MINEKTSKKFQRRAEDFTCEKCGEKIIGTGYTNHCPKCLWSKHVDINPGDRASECQGMMIPASLEIKNGEYIITHKCQKCGFEKKNKTAENDDMDTIIKTSKSGA